MKNKILFSLITALFFSVTGQAQDQLLKLLQTNGDSIGLNVRTIWKAVETSAGCNVSVGTKTYSLSTSYDNFISLSGGQFTSYNYVVGTGTRTFAINKSALLRAYKAGTKSTVWLSHGATSITLDIPFDALFNAGSVALTEFTSFDTTVYVVPPGATALQITCVGAGGGGGSGRRGVTLTPRSGGSGGGGGGVSEVTIETASFALDTLIIMVGRGGDGGAAVTANTTNGNAGSAGVESKVLHGASVLVKASGGSGGAAGTALPVVAGAGGTVGDFAGSAGGASDTTGVGTVGVSANTKTTGGGGGGGGLTSFNVAVAGGAGGAGFYGLQSGGATNTAATALSVGRYIGGGGGGGTSHASNAGGTGGAGVAGGGGGGGAASTNGANSGAGGAGGNGYIRIVPIFN